MSGFSGSTEAGVLHGYDVVNNLTSTSTTTPLSANMGKALNDNINSKMADASFSTFYHIFPLTLSLPNNFRGLLFWTSAYADKAHGMALISCNGSGNSIKFPMDTNPTYSMTISGRAITIENTVASTGTIAAYFCIIAFNATDMPTVTN